MWHHTRFRHTDTDITDLNVQLCKVCHVSFLCVCFPQRGAEAGLPEVSASRRGTDLFHTFYYTNDFLPPVPDHGFRNGGLINRLWRGEDLLPAATELLKLRRV